MTASMKLESRSIMQRSRSTFESSHEVTSSRQPKVGETQKYSLVYFDPLLNGSGSLGKLKTKETQLIDSLSYSTLKPLQPLKNRRAKSLSLLPSTLRYGRITPNLSPLEMEYHLEGVGSSHNENRLDCSLQSKLSPTSLLKDANNLIMRTSEQDPSAHQVDIPEAKEMLSNMKVCALMDSFHKSSDFRSLVGVSNLCLKEFSSLGKTSTKGSKLQERHRPIVQELLKNGEGITVEGYASETAEVAIFYVPSRSKILVVFRGNDEQQSKPVKKIRKNGAQTMLFSGDKASVHPLFKTTYLELESKFLSIVDQMREENPFVQVDFCGHSFGGALATLAGVRYACNRPTVRVSVHAFGSPKIGTVEFRRLANSFSNLRIVRVELEKDPILESPPDPTWEHVGHSIAIGRTKVEAYRFDRSKPPSSKNLLFAHKKERDSQAYCAALEHCVERKQWARRFVGEDVGRGVRGTGNENRHMV